VEDVEQSVAGGGIGRPAQDAGRLANDLDVRMEKERANAIRNEYICGYGAAATNVPPALRQAMLLLIAHWFENREAVVTGTIATTIPLSARSLIYSQTILEAPVYLEDA
jgi:uncharacterized phiE125 gp8 family phage protein